jgi:hypothetical protein
MATKTCKKCGEEKPLEAFHRDAAAKHGRRQRCKVCELAGIKARREDSKVEIQVTCSHCNKTFTTSDRRRKACSKECRKTSQLSYKKKWVEENKEHAKHYRKDYHQRNMEKVHSQQKAYYEANKEAHKARMHNYYKSNKGDYLERNRSWRKHNRDEINSRRRDKLSTDPYAMLKHKLRARLSAAIRNGYKSGSAISDLGCSVEYLKEVIEKLFYEDENGVMMSWENWGDVWQLDHIYPLACADLENRVEFLAANNWRNLQPLTFEENQNKKDKVTPEARRLFNKLKKEFEKEK